MLELEFESCLGLELLGFSVLSIFFSTPKRLFSMIANFLQSCADKWFQAIKQTTKNVNITLLKVLAELFLCIMWTSCVICDVLMALLPCKYACWKQLMVQ